MAGAGIHGLMSKGGEAAKKAARVGSAAAK
jgi:hypothetical protein